MAQTAVAVSPFRCRWIPVPSGTDVRTEEWTYAICLHSRDHPRVVTEDDCRQCACWESRIDRLQAGGASTKGGPSAFLL